MTVLNTYDFIETSPVLLIVFNRPHETAQVLSRLRDSGVKSLFIACDAPRSNVEGEFQLVEAVKCLINEITWCDHKHTLFHPFNIGCGAAGPAAIDWFFSHVDQGIILEDDCLPAISFVALCSHLLSVYRHHQDAWMISGYNPVGASIHDDRLFKSYVPNTWGWATWRSRWEKYQRVIDWPDPAVLNLYRNKFNIHIQNYYRSSMKAVARGRIPTAWDYQWIYTIHKNAGYAIKPYSNLISNIGPHGTHSAGVDINHFCPFGEFNLAKALVDSFSLSFDPKQDQQFFAGRIDSLAKDYVKRVTRRLLALFHAN